jgi:hypothetical protein
MFTQKVFKNKNILNKLYEGEMKMLMRTSASSQTKATKGVSSDRQAANRFLFMLKIKDNALFDIPGIDLREFPKKIFYFSNHLNDFSLSVDQCLVLDGQLFIPYDQRDIPHSETIWTNDDDEIHHSTISRATTGFKLDLSRHQAGIYKLITTPAASKKKRTQFIYYNPMARKEPLLGLVDIRISDPTSAREEERTFVISLGTEELSA